MSSTNRNRGPEGRDDYFFGSLDMQQRVVEAVSDLSFLLARGYGVSSACQLVGNQYKLSKRQQLALRGMSASKMTVQKIAKKKISKEALKDRKVSIDGFNVLILMESILSDAYIFKGMDGAYRDLSSIHGSYKKVSQTQKAIELVGAFFEHKEVKEVSWVFDKPVSNSGRMKSEVLSIAQEKGWNWNALLDYNPDKYLVKLENEIIVSSDAWILDQSKEWFNLIEEFIPKDYAYLLSC